MDGHRGLAIGRLDEAEDLAGVLSSSSSVGNRRRTWSDSEVGLVCADDVGRLHD